MADKKGGLEGVVALPSAICKVDGEKGKLYYRGIDVHELAEKSTFEETSYLLWYGELPTRRQLAELRERIACCRDLPEELVQMIMHTTPDAHPMEVLRTAISALSRFDPQGPVLNRAADMDLSILLAAKVPVIVATYHRARKKLPLTRPREELGPSGNFLYMLTGEVPSERNAKVLDKLMILHADHELNASTFTARVVASTLADIYAAASAAMGALSGPLHGGANEDVMRMLVEIGDASRAEAYVKEKLSSGGKIPGFGHRVYRTADPRGLELVDLDRQLAEEAGEMRLYETSQRVEQVMAREKANIHANLDFYSALAYHFIGIPSDLFTPVFACSRIVGWTAHVLEQYENNRLIRPVADYSGPNDVEYVPIDDRGRVAA